MILLLSLKKILSREDVSKETSLTITNYWRNNDPSFELENGSIVKYEE